MHFIYISFYLYDMHIYIYIIYKFKKLDNFYVNNKIIKDM